MSKVAEVSVRNTVDRAVMMRRVVVALLLVIAVPLLGDDLFTGSLRLRLENWAWFETPGYDDHYTFLGAQLRFGAKPTIGKFAAQLEFEAPLLKNLPVDAVAPSPQGQLGLGANYYQANNSGEDAAGIFLKQAWFRYGMFRAGRFEFIEGNERMPDDPQLAAVRRDRVANRLIGTFGFSHVGRAFDGVELDGDSWTLLAAKPTKGVFRVHGGESIQDVGFVYGSWSRSTPVNDVRLFGIAYEDDRGLVKPDNRPSSIREQDHEDIRLGTIGGHAIFKAGKVDFLVWGVYQGGDWGTLHHSAGAMDLEAGWQLPLANLRVGWYRSSGDDDPTDDEHGTFFPLLPTPRAYARFPFYNAMNSNDLFAQVGGVKVHPTLTLQSEVHLLTLSNDADLWYAGGGAFEDDTFGVAGRTSNGHGDLATTLDLSAVYKPSPAMEVTFYVGHAFGGDVVDAIYEKNGATFGYLEWLWKF
jgi:hypothetical protein